MTAFESLFSFVFLLVHSRNTRRKKPLCRCFFVFFSPRLQPLSLCLRRRKIEKKQQNHVSFLSTASHFDADTDQKYSKPIKKKQTNATDTIFVYCQSLTGGAGWTRQLPTQQSGFGGYTCIVHRFGHASSTSLFEPGTRYLLFISLTPLPTPTVHDGSLLVSLHPPIAALAILDDLAFLPSLSYTLSCFFHH